MTVRLSELIILIALLSFVTIDLGVVGLIHKVVLRILLAIFVIFVWLKSLPISLSVSKVRLVYLAMLMLISVSTLWSNNFLTNQLYAFDLLFYALFTSSYFIYFNKISDEKLLRSLTNGASYFLALFVVLAFHAPNQFIHHDVTGFYRLGAHALNSNFLAVVALIPIIQYFFSESRRSTTQLLFHVALPIAVLFFAASRAPTILVLVAIIAVLMRLRKLGSLFGLSFILLGITVLYWEEITVQFRLLSLPDVMTGTGRTVLWLDLLSNLKLWSAMFGHGAFDVAQQADAGRIILNGHNSLVNALLFGGVGALLLHLFLTVYLSKYWLHKYLNFSDDVASRGSSFILIFLAVILGMQITEGAFAGRNSLLLFLSTWILWFISRKEI